MTALVRPVPDTIRLPDGSIMSLRRVPDVDDATWEEVKNYMRDNPDLAKGVQKYARNPEAMRGWLQTQAIAEHYHSKLESGDVTVQACIRGFEKDPELTHIFLDLQKNGVEAAMRYCQDEELMLKMSRKMGGVPKELQPKLQKIGEASLTIHEACKNGDNRAVHEYLAKRLPLDVQDHRGITPLGYAIGANRIGVVKQLLEGRANPFAVDSSGNGGLHYAAGYGRKELLEYLLKVGTSVHQQNSQGQTPLAVATLNKQAPTMELLVQHGAS